MNALWCTLDQILFSPYLSFISSEAHIYPMHLITTYRTEKGSGRGTGARHKRQGTSKTYILGISQRMHVYTIKIVLE